MGLRSLKDKGTGTRREEGWGILRSPCCSLRALYEPSEALALPSLTLTRQGTIPGRFSESPTIREDPTK